MENLFASLLENNTKPTNPDIMNGLACKIMPLAEQYIDSVFKSVAKSLPPDLEYVGCARCTPHEEYQELTRCKTNRRSYDLSASYLYMMKYFLRYEGEDLPPKYIQLPYVTDAGIMYLGGTRYHISPVMTDSVISPSDSTIFIRLLRDKFTLERCYHTYIVNGRRETGYVIWSPINRTSKKTNKLPPTTKANPGIVHYLLGRYGFTNMFKNSVGFVPTVLTTEQANTPEYRNEDWVICESIDIAPRTYITNDYKRSSIALAIPKDKWTDQVQMLVVGFYYVVDHFPNRIYPNHLDDTNIWKILLGNIYFTGHIGEGRLFESIEKHYKSLDDYLDTIVKEKLAIMDIHVNDFYELLANLVIDFNKWTNGSTAMNNSLYGKTMDVLYTALFAISSTIFGTNYALNQALAKKNRLSKKEIIDTLARKLKTGAVYGLTKQNPCCNTVAYSGDNMYVGITAMVALQQSSKRQNMKHSTNCVGPDDRLDVSDIEVGSILHLGKKKPDPAGHANPYMNVDLHTGQIVRNPELVDVLELTNTRMRKFQL